MIGTILLRAMRNAHSIHYHGRDRNDDDEVQHMCPVEVQREQLFAEVLEEVILGLARVAQSIDRVWHIVGPSRISYEAALARREDGVNQRWAGMFVECVVRLRMVVECQARNKVLVRGSASQDAEVLML
jgi:hypothetical protein